MRRSLRAPLATLTLAFGLVFSPAAWAQEDWGSEDDFDIEGDEEEAPDDSERLDKGDDLDSVDDSGDESLEEFADPGDENFDLLGEDGPVASDSGDSPGVFRDQQDKLKNAAPDEEIQAWEQYLQTYPNTAFRDRITKRIQELEEKMYRSNVIIDDDGPTDAMDQEIGFSQALQLENIDPRTRLQFGAEWGLPAYINLFVDYEHQIVRKLSAHVGAKRRYTGYSIEAGPRWAIVKSTRTQTLVTFIGDLHFNTIPSFLGIRPQLAIGKRFGDRLDAQIMAGPDMELQAFDTGMPIRLVGGVNLTFDASDTVKVFLESGLNMKELTREGGMYRYNVVTFGMKFFPKKDKNTDMQSDDVEVNLGATVPYTYNYWTYHYGSVMVQSNMYL